MKKLFTLFIAAAVFSIGVGIPTSQIASAHIAAVNAQESDGAPMAVAEEAIAEEEDGNAILLNGLEMVSLLLACIAVYILILIIKQFGASAISHVFGYFIIGTVLVASARLFILLTSFGVLNLSSETLNLGWHLLFFLSMVTFFIAGKNFAKLGTDTVTTSGSANVIGWGLACTVFTVLLFILAPSFDEPFTTMFAGSIADKSGLMHLVAFLLGSIAAFYLFYRSKMGKITSLLATPYLIAFGLFGLNHAWELMFESWHIVDVSDATGERIEQFFVLPAFMLMTYAYIRLWSLLRPRA